MRASPRLLPQSPAVGGVGRWVAKWVIPATVIALPTAFSPRKAGRAELLSTSEMNQPFLELTAPVSLPRALLALTSAKSEVGGAAGDQPLFVMGGTGGGLER